MGANFLNQTKFLTKEPDVFANIVHRLTKTSNISKLLKKRIGDIKDVIETADTCAVLYWNNTAKLLQPYAAFGYDQESFFEVALRSGEGVPGGVYEDGKSRLCETPEACADAVMNFRPDNRLKWIGSDSVELKSMLAIPISGGIKKFGVLVLEIRKGLYPFSSQDRTYAQIFADLIAMAFERISPDFSGDLQPYPHSQHQLEMEWVETISHELRLPLTAIKGYATALLLDEVEWSLSKRQEFLEMIEEECDQMETMLGDLLNAALVNVTQLPLEMQQVNLSKIARDISDEMERRTENHQILIDFPEEFPFVQADPRWIKQVFRNLFDNAIKYSPDGGLIYIHGEIRSMDVVVKISDPGIGIPPEDLIPLFERRIRSKHLSDIHVPSSGLGLPITRTIVEAHGGRIWAQSQVGQGTTMSFSLPVEEDSTPYRR